MHVAVCASLLGSSVEFYMEALPHWQDVRRWRLCEVHTIFDEFIGIIFPFAPMLSFG